jgi:hypothetical protein
MFKPESPFRADRAPQEKIHVPQDLVDRLFLEMSLDLPDEEGTDIEPLIRFLAARKGLRTDRMRRHPHGGFTVEKDTASTPVEIHIEEISLGNDGIVVGVKARAQPDFESSLDASFSWSEYIQIKASPEARRIVQKRQDEAREKREAEEAEAQRTNERLLPGAIAFMKGLGGYGDALSPAQLGGLGKYLTEALGWEMEPTDLVRIRKVSERSWHVYLEENGITQNVAEIDAPQ